MHQTNALVQTLKQTLKGHGKTYSDVAKALNLSEVSVKRLFVTKNFSLARIEKVCLMLDMDIYDLFKIMEERNRYISQLTLEQEQNIANDTKLLLVTVCALNRYTIRDILERYRLTEAECIGKLTKLDKMKIIALLPKNKIKLLISPNFSWIPGGPIKQFFESRVQSDFFGAEFSSDGELLICVNGLLTNQSNLTIQKKLEHLVADFINMNRDDASQPINIRQGTTLVMAIRAWEPIIFKDFRKF